MFEKIRQIRNKGFGYILRIIVKFLMMVCNLIAGIIYVINKEGITLNNSLLAAIFFVNMFTMVLLRASQGLGTFLDKYTKDQNQLLLKMDELGQTVSTINSARTEITSQAQQSTSREPIAVNLPAPTPRFQCHYDKNTDTIVVTQLEEV